jgi:hypothetical protein
MSAYDDHRMDDDLEFTEEEKRRLEELRQAMTKKYDEICSEIARHMGISDDPDKLSEKDREMVAQRADKAIEDWDARDTLDPLKPQLVTSLFPLLRAHHHLWLEFANIRDEAVERTYGSADE